MTRIVLIEVPSVHTAAAVSSVTTAAAVEPSGVGTWGASVMSSESTSISLPVEFVGFASTGDPLFRINGGRTALHFSQDDLLDAFRGMLPTEDVALGKPVHIEPGWRNHPRSTS
jgi:poly(3-hydroxybutyrate) depolymerase